jgi:hypothetical protein
MRCIGICIIVTLLSLSQIDPVTAQRSGLAFKV